MINFGAGSYTLQSPRLKSTQLSNRRSSACAKLTPLIFLKNVLLKLVK